MSNEIMQENTPFVECSAFHRGMSVLEASLRNTEDSEAIISGLLKGAAEFYGASRASVVEADWDLGIGVITYEWCKDGVPAQRDMLQCLPMEKFPRWRKALRANKAVVISDLQRLEKVYPDEAAFFREYNNEQAKANQRIMDAAQTLENASPYITEWDESAVRQLVETVKILSKDEVAVTLKGGIEICQKIMY